MGVRHLSDTHLTPTRPDSPGLEKSEGITALVMELVEGPDLANLIAGSGLSAVGSGKPQRDRGPGPEPKAQSREPKAWL